MVKLEDLLTFYKWTNTHIDMYKCQQLKEKGFLQMKKHQEYPLYLLNYTAKTQYQRQWCKELIHSRGLIVAEDGEIVARPLPKFFNEWEITDWGDLQEQEYELYKKMDGSLAVMFHYMGKRIFCTRGSFCSDQALKAEEIFKEKYLNQDVNKECTYCFEVIYPENKIVVDYGALEDLFLVSITHTKSNKHVNIEQAGFKTPQKISTTGICCTEWTIPDVENEEGYVMRFISDNLRVKIKFDNYMEKHRSKTVSLEDIKRSVKRMERVNLENIPDEFLHDVKIVILKMENDFNDKKIQHITEYLNIVHRSNNEMEVIEAIKLTSSPSVLFAMYREKPFDRLIWKSIE